MEPPKSALLVVLRELELAIAAVFCLVAVGVAGFRLIEGWSFPDSLYMTIITLSTVGFGEVHKLSPPGRLFTMLLIVFGVGIALWVATAMVQLVLSRDTRSLLRRRRMRNEISRMKDHFIVCGYGRIGREVCASFRRRNVPHVVADTDPSSLEELEGVGTPFIHGDASDDGVLKTLGIERARGLIAVAGSDADNTFIVLSARALRPDMVIVARSTTPDAERKLMAAGANRVMSPYVSGARRIAAAATQPNVVEFLDVAMQGDEMSLALEEALVAENSPLVGRTLADSEIRQRSGVVVVAIKQAGGTLVSNPPPEMLICAGDILIAVGAVAELEKLVTLAGKAVVQ